MRKFLMAAALVAVTTPALVTPALAVTNWQIDPKVSKLTWVAQFNKQPVAGQFEKWSGVIAFDPNDLKNSSIAITVDLTSVQSGDANRDGTLKGPDFFNTASAATATFVSKEIKKTSQGYVAGGMLTLGGVTKPLALPFTLDIKDKKALGQGKIKLSRTAFGVGKGQWAKAGEIADLVEVTFTVSADAK